MKRRIDHLKSGTLVSTPASDAQWRKTRVDRMLVEHFLRVGYYDTAVSLAKHFDIEDLTNINLFLVATASFIEASTQCGTALHPQKLPNRQILPFY